jgi:hypothetical protein
MCLSKAQVENASVAIMKVKMNTIHNILEKPALRLRSFDTGFIDASQSLKRLGQVKIFLAS